ncbi:MAG: diguanylate cyclase [Coriobacteriia bacterium]|nr:diguanylate cyclase [Coriobacteriia bacterium]
MTTGNRGTADVTGGDATNAAGGLGTRLFGTLATIGFAALCLVYLGAAALPVGQAAQFLISDLAFLIPIGAVVVTGFVAYRRSEGSEARFWLLLTSANAVIFVSEMYYVWWMVSIGKPPPPVYAPFQILHISAAGIFLVLLLSMTKYQNATGPQKIRYAFDGLAVVTVVYVAVFTGVVEPMFAGIAGVSTIDYLAGASYPLWGLVVIAGSLATMLGFKLARWRPWEKFVTLSMIIYGAGIAAWPLWYVTFKAGGSVYERGVLDLVLVLGHYLLVLATSYRLTMRGQGWPLRPMPLFQPSGDRRLSYVVPALTLAALPVMVYAATRPEALPRERLVFIIAATILAAVTVARTALVAVENGRLFHRSVTDPLTGLFNHRFFHERLGLELDLAKRYRESLSLIVLDIDDFDVVNNVHGHPAGDELLRQTATAIRSACRDSDAVCRVGGDEFAAILPSTDLSEALGVAIRIQDALRAVHVRGENAVTISAGVVGYPTHGDAAPELVRLADGAAYWVKHHGKDQAIVYDADVVTELSPEERIRTIEEQTHLGTVRALAAAVDARDPDTQYHSRNVAALSVQVARELGLDSERCRLLEAAALMHDIGKIGVADDVLGKPGPLDPDEMAHVREHPELGERILGSTMMDDVLPWIRHHHERWDGEGYPDGLRAVAIPLEARILAVCDAWDAMVSERPYRGAIERGDAVTQLVNGMGSQFDPAVVEVFLRTLGHEAPVS